MMLKTGSARMLCLATLCLGGCRGCAKTPVPFKRPRADGTSADASVQVAPVSAGAEIDAYADGTQRIRVHDLLIERPGTVRASWWRQGEDQPGVVLVVSDEQGRTLLEVTGHDSAEARAQLLLTPFGAGQSCHSVDAKLSALAPDLGLASVDFLCHPDSAADSGGAIPAAVSGRTSADSPTSGAVPSSEPGGSTVPSRPAAIGGETPRAPAGTVPANLNVAAPAAIGGQNPSVPGGSAAANPASPNLPSSNPAFDAPPEPSAEVAQTHYFIFSLEPTPRLLLQTAATWDTDAEPLSNELSIIGDDLDHDGHGDVQITFPLASRSAAPTEITLTWLNRPTGLARERTEPERTLAGFAEQALRRSDKQPQPALDLAERTLRLHALLCRESGTARLWVDRQRGVPCAASAAAGKAAAARAIAAAKQQRLLTALDARASLDAPGYALDKKTRDRVNQAIGTIRGDTNYRWQPGPSLRPLSAPNLRLSMLGFSDDDTLLLRGPIAQTYDVATRSASKTEKSGSVLAVDPTQHLALTDIVRGCDGYHVRLVPPGQVIAGVVAGPSASEPLLQPLAADAEATPCSAPVHPKSESGGFVLLGLNAHGALFARGTNLFELPLDPNGGQSGVRSVPASEKLPPLFAPGPIDLSGRYFALATSEGVAVVDRSAGTAKLVRRPASCAAGPVSDVALAPSGRRLAMLCGAHLYVAVPAAVSDSEPRPFSETQ
jgi:hypothetical protein